MKKIMTMVVAVMVALSFSMVAVAEEKNAEKTATEKSEKGEKKDIKKTKDAKKSKGAKTVEAKPAAKGKKEVSGC
ncbi:MAG TPA: hypothetical protein HPP94_16555 [Desulfuromonadales bacterium]|nr:hypothetical protein [Desulfuromonadales bacterium]